MAHEPINFGALLTTTATLLIALGVTVEFFGPVKRTNSAGTDTSAEKGDEGNPSTNSSFIDDVSTRPGNLSITFAVLTVVGFLSSLFGVIVKSSSVPLALVSACGIVALFACLIYVVFRSARLKIEKNWIAGFVGLSILILTLLSFIFPGNAGLTETCNPVASHGEQHACPEPTPPTTTTHS